MSVKFCREKLDRERPNLPTITNEKLKIGKSSIIGSKSKGPKIPPSKTTTNVNKVYLFTFIYYFIV